MQVGNHSNGNNVRNRNIHKKHNAECIVDDSGIKILVSYWYEKSPSDVYEGHGYHELGRTLSTELESVEVILGEEGRGIDIISLLHENEKEYVIEKLKYD